MCDECGIQPANFHVKLIDGNGDVKEKGLCADCLAKNQKILADRELPKLAAMLENLLETARNNAKDDEPVPEITCSACGTRYADFRETGRLGCPRCYEAFREPLTKLLAKTRGFAPHKGRTPEGASREASIRLRVDQLRQQLTQAISCEAYEDAARLRDEIHALEEQLRETN